MKSKPKQNKLILQFKHYNEIIHLDDVFDIFYGINDHHEYYFIKIVYKNNNEALIKYISSTYNLNKEKLKELVIKDYYYIYNAYIEYHNISINKSETYSFKKD